MRPAPQRELRSCGPVSVSQDKESPGHTRSPKPKPKPEVGRADRERMTVRESRQAVRIAGSGLIVC